MGFVDDIKKSVRHANNKSTVPKTKSDTNFQDDAGVFLGKILPVDKSYVPPRICTDCGCQGIGKPKNKVHFIVELIVWVAAINWIFQMFPILIAIVFSIWRRSGDDYCCYECGGRMISTSSPRGKSLVEQYHSI